MDMRSSAGALRASPHRTKSGRLSAVHRSLDDIETVLVPSAEASPAVPARGHRKTPSYRKILTKLREKHLVLSTLVVGDQGGGPLPLLGSLLDPAWRLRWQAQAVHEGLWEWAGARDSRVTMQLSGITLDPNLAFEAVRSAFLAEARRCDVVVLCFSLVSPLSLQRAVRTSQMMATALAGARSAPLVFLVGTLRELRDALALGRQEDALHELVRHYVNQGLLSTDDAKSFASGSMRTVSEAKIREAMLAANAAFYAEVCFLPTAGNTVDVFSAMAEKAAQLRRHASARAGAGKHRRSRSSVSTRDVLDSPDEDAEPELANLAATHLPDSFTMDVWHGAVVEWLEDELATVVRPVTPRDGLSRSAYKQLLSSTPPTSSEAAQTCPLEGFQRKEWPTGDVYEGEWRDHLYHGTGTLTLVNGSSYKGQFAQGLFDGRGEFRAADGSSYTGSWQGGKRNGKGEQRYADGSSFVGYWLDDVRHGDGILSYANGTIYAGGFLNDLFHGKGRYTFNTGSTYEGVWVMGKKTGSGTLHRFDGTMRKLTYQDDVLLAQEAITEPKEVKRKASLRTQLSSSAFILMTALDLGELTVDESAVLGEGFYGIVYRGTYKGADVAVKRLRPNIPDNALAKFLAEVTILAGLENEYVVRYLGAVFEENNLCIVTAYYGGGTLWEKIHDSSATFTMAFIYKICFEIASAMHYLHNECEPAIVHRDLKSPNVLLTTGLSVRLADFGLARHLQRSADTLTKGIGTASWSAPEILRSQNYSTSADVYSFAIIVWELFARKPPFHPLERDQILLAVAVDNARPNMPPDVPVEWRSLMENCWQTEPEERPKFNEILEWFKRNPVA